jgi:hypothetical protein
MKEWTPNSNYGGHAFGFTANKEKKTTQFDEFLAGRDAVLPWIAESAGERRGWFKRSKEEHADRRK